MTDKYDTEFGFTITSQKEILEKEAEQLNSISSRKAEAIYDVVIPLLTSLKKDAETKEYIFWPNRAEAIEKIIAEIESVLDRG